MANHALIDVSEPPSQRPGRRLFAPPSRAGMLICAASLMPAYMFALLGWHRLVAIMNIWMSPVPADSSAAASYWMALAQHLLTGAFLSLVAWLFLIRRPSVEPGQSRSRLADAGAVAGSVIVTGITLAPQTIDDLLVIAASEALLTIGLIVMVVSLASLGRSFGVMPRARGLVRTGMYRWVRHPIYLGEFLAFGGMLLPTLSPFTVAVYVTFVLLQAYRMTREEKTLEAAYPEYATYRAETARLLPGVY